MPTECSRDRFGFEAVEGRQVVAAFDGGQVTSDAGALLLGAVNRAIGLVGRLAGCFADGRRQELVEHGVETMLMQRICGLALGYEDLVDHDELRHDPVLATLVGKLEARRRLRLRPRPQPPPAGRDQRSARRRRGRACRNRPAGPAIRRLHLCHPRQLAPRTAGRGQGRASGQGPQPALRGDLAAAVGDRRPEPLHAGRRTRTAAGSNSSRSNRGRSALPGGRVRDRRWASRSRMIRSGGLACASRNRATNSCSIARGSWPIL